MVRPATTCTHEDRITNSQGLTAKPKLWTQFPDHIILASKFTSIGTTIRALSEWVQSTW